jgi:acetylornithine/succinyldiaminopimelate/putrescine aminotransferase
MFEAARQSVKGRNNIVVTRSILNQVGERCQGVKERSESLKKHMEKVKITKGMGLQMQIVFKNRRIR